jgi:hypothetical protein
MIPQRRVNERINRYGWTRERAESVELNAWRRDEKYALKHGHRGPRNDTRSLTYNSWRCMHDRCHQESHPWWERYGGRGIMICARWRGKNGFENFLTDMGERPGRGMTIDRIDSNGNYEKDNCRWAPKTLQRANLLRAA